MPQIRGSLDVAGSLIKDNGKYYFYYGQLLTFINLIFIYIYIRELKINIVVRIVLL